MAMAAVVLSSSPSCSPIAITPPHAAAAAMSSSPGLPSPSLLFSKMGSSLVSGSRATPIPTDAVPEFASASTLLRRARSIDETGSPSSTKAAGLSERYDLQSSGKVMNQPEELRGKNEEVPAFKKPRVLHEKRPDTTQEKIARTSAVRSANAVEKADILAPKKTRKKKNKDESEAQTTIKKTKIIKPGAVKSGKIAVGSTKKGKAAVSVLLRPPASTQEEDLRAREEFRDLCLEKAITRRKEWTPCKDTAPDPILQYDFEKSIDPKVLVDAPSVSEPLISRFGNLLGDFGFAQKEGTSVGICETTRQGNDEAMMKRRKIELVNGVPAPRISEKLKKCKSPKKKPQTVTEKATAPFAPIEALATPSLLQYLGAPTAESVNAIDNSDTPVTVRRRPPVKKTATSKPKTTQAKKSVKKQPILLSPESAMKTARNQELIFGTSSQLAREESPTLIRDLQQAMKESESTVEQKQPPAKDYEFLDLPSGRSRSSNVRAITASKSLWSAASRDIDGSLVEVEIVNLADTPKPFRATRQPISVLKMPDSSEPQPKAQEDRAPSNADQGVPIPSKLNMNDTPDLRQQIHERDLIIPRSVAEAALKTRPKSKSPVKKDSTAKPATNQMPNYKGFTDVQLSKEIASYGFKSIKKRETMIMLLEKCWESKMSMALQEVPANVSLPQPVAENTNTETSKQTSPSKKRGRPPKSSDQVVAIAGKVDGVTPKKPRGRPKKDPTATTPSKRKRKSKVALSDALVSAADDEIYDSSPPTPSPPRRHIPPKSPGQLPLSQPLGISTNNATTAIKGKDRGFLLSQITKAITTFPPTNDVKNLTWYEKMLMYDPIVLEDLTVWLNTEGLGRVGEDDEVGPSLVKEWCEERSVCCLWRENLRGGARERW
ncbi:MAG: 5'-flap endonuclease [Alectoria fallacina]|uniref:Structure-specific endonuclease subunit SLX4 n=1 Tax=Alectoria fallacina TaxID=1903189 RepID=A0A8H3J9E4_9LECA|nr:MAG: 5'-flap endonuclease [Alectoria fallacina]